MLITKYLPLWNMLTLAHRSPTKKMRGVWRTLLQCHSEFGSDPILARTLSKLARIETRGQGISTEP